MSRSLRDTEDGINEKAWERAMRSPTVTERLNLWLEDDRRQAARELLEARQQAEKDELEEKHRVERELFDRR